MQHVTTGANTLAGKRILVTGGSGFVGMHLVQRLLAEGALVGALARHEQPQDWQASCAAYTFFACDLTNAASITAVCETFTPQILVHCAAFPDGGETFPRFQAVIQHNLLGTVHALEAFRLCGGELFIYCDSTKVYGSDEVPYREAMPLKPLSSYAITKAAGWQFCDLYRRLYGMATVAIRPTLTYGPRQGYNLFSYVADCVLNCKPEVRLDGGTQTRDPIYIDDVVDAFVATVQQGTQVSGRVINIGGGQELTVSALAALVVELMGSQVPVVSVPAQARPTEMWRNYCDNVEAQAILGWVPRTDIRTGLQRTLAYMDTTRTKVG